MPGPARPADADGQPARVGVQADPGQPPPGQRRGGAVPRLVHDRDRVPQARPGRQQQQRADDRDDQHDVERRGRRRGRGDAPPDARRTTPATSVTASGASRRRRGSRGGARAAATSAMISDAAGEGWEEQQPGRREHAGVEVADARAAGHDDDEDALQPPAHRVGRGGLQHRPPEDRAHVVGGARPREQHRGERRSRPGPRASAGPGVASPIARDREHRAEQPDARAVRLRSRARSRGPAAARRRAARRTRC